MKKVSYLIALYNKVEHICAAIDSVLSDGTSGVEIEIVVVDDGSSDGSFELVSSHYKGDARVQLSSLGVNRGKNAAYNQAYKMCAGDYVSILGADDLIISGRTSNMLSSCEASGAAVYGGLIKRHVGTGRVEEFFPDEDITFEDNLIQNGLPGGCLMLSRSLADLLFPIPEELGFEDWWMSFHLLRLGKVAVLKRHVLMYQMHEKNDCGASVLTPEVLRRDYKRHLDYLNKFYPFLEEGRHRLIWRRSRSIRLAVLGKGGGWNILYRPFDMSWLKLLVALTLGARGVVVASRIKKLIREL